MSLCALALASALGLAPSPAPASLAASLPPAASSRAPSIQWRGEKLELAALPAELPEGAREALAYWSPWAEENDFSMWLTDDARVLLVDESKKISSREWKMVGETLAAVDALVPLPARDAAVTTPGTRDASSDEGTTWSWSDLPLLEHHTAAFFRLSGKKEFGSLLAFVAEREDLGSGWVGQHGSSAGIVLHRPLAGVIVDNAPGVEEWDPMNEMVNRLARLLVARRFGNVPNWISMGVAWHAEMSVRGNIFCFPHRGTFVGVAEHNGWKAPLKKEFKKKNGPDLDLQRLATWRRGTWDPVQAGHAWGTVTYLHEVAPGALSLVIDDLRRLTESEGRIDHADGTWELVPGFEPSPAAQLEILERRVHPEFLAGVTEYFRKGMRAPKR